MKNFRFVLLFLIPFLILSCSNHEEVSPEISVEEFIISVGDLIDANTNKGLTFSQLKPIILKMADDNGISVKFPSKIADDTILDNKATDKAFCWPWEDTTVEAFHDYGEGDQGPCAAYLVYCGGEFDSWEYSCW